MLYKPFSSQKYKLFCIFLAQAYGKSTFNFEVSWGSKDHIQLARICKLAIKYQGR